MAAITLEHVTKEFAAGVVAVDDVNLTIEDGEFMVLVGPSGCGKSTLLRMIAGLEEITDGTISIGDRDVTELPPPAPGRCSASRISGPARRLTSRADSGNASRWAAQSFANRLRS